VEINHGYGKTFSVLLLYTLKTMLKKYHREKSTAVLGPGANVENPVLRLNPPAAAEDATRGDDDDPTEDPKAAKVVVVVVVVVVFLSAANPFCLLLCLLLLSPIQFIKVDFFE
tara:strand:- start:71 stop:409 length:339 start_codon:yes stop_codon:yes gene_type:complete